MDEEKIRYIEELISLPVFYYPTISWDKSKVAFYWDVTGKYELYVKNIETGKIKKVSDGQLPPSPTSPISWSRDDKYIVVGIDKGGNEQYDIYAFEIETCKLIKVTESEGQNRPGQFSHDNKKLIVNSTREGQMNLYILDWETKGIRKLTDFDNPVHGGIWTKDDKWIYFMTNEVEDLRNLDIYRIRSDGTGKERFLGMEDGSRDYITDISSNNLAAITSDFSGLWQPGVLNLNTKEIKWFGDGEHEEFAVKFSSNNRYLLTTKSINAEQRPFLYEVESGKRLDLELPKGVYYTTQFAGENKLLLEYSSPTHRKRMLLYDIEKSSYKVFQEAEYGLLNPENFSDAECVRYKSKDGTEIEAILYKPKDIEEGEKVPAIVFPHGGPYSQSTLSFDIYAQCFASWKLAVILPNFRGSAGYGKNFADALTGDWGGKDADDILASAEYLKNFDWIDSNRIAIAGISYGAYAVYYQMVRNPNVWRAGIAWNGITDLLKLYEEVMPHTKYILHRYLGDPNKNKNLWIERSPITYANNFRGPLLMIHGINDPRCPVSQARLFREKLIELGFREGKDFEYHELAEEGHGSFAKEQRREALKIMLDFLRRKLL